MTSSAGLRRPSSLTNRPGTRSTRRPWYTKCISGSATPRLPTGARFLRSAAVAMQHILVDHARRKRAAKRGGYAHQFTVKEGDRVIIADPDTLLDIDAALTRLSAEDPSSADVARFRLFAGMSIDEAALALGLSRATAFREWAYARSWLTTALAPGTDPGVRQARIGSKHADRNGYAPLALFRGCLTHCRLRYTRRPRQTPGESRHPVTHHRLTESLVGAIRPGIRGRGCEAV